MIDDRRRKKQAAADTSSSEVMADFVDFIVGDDSDDEVKRVDEFCDFLLFLKNRLEDKPDDSALIARELDMMTELAFRHSYCYGEACHLWLLERQGELIDGETAGTLLHHLIKLNAEKSPNLPLYLSISRRLIVTRDGEGNEDVTIPIPSGEGEPSFGVAFTSPAGRTRMYVHLMPGEESGTVATIELFGADGSQLPAFKIPGFDAGRAESEAPHE